MRQVWYQVVEGESGGCVCVDQEALGRRRRMGSVRRRMKGSTGRARRVGGRQGNEMYEPLASPLDCERHIFIVLAKKAAKAGIG
jgi:hypothetical protein